MSLTRFCKHKIIRKKKSVKNSKGHLSKCAFNKKLKKIYYQHYTDDAKNTTIDFVNDDCLADIFKYLSAWKRPKVASVCKKWKKSYVKKSKGRWCRSHISTLAFNKKKEKRNYLHCNEDDKNTTIDFVNVDCLAEIFKYVPACERPKIASVCKKWKEAFDYSWQNVKKLELTHWEYNECPSYLKKYQKIDEQARFLRSLLDKCGRYLTELDLTAHGYNGIVQAINENCPNLVKLRLRFKYIEPTVNVLSRLSKLKVLKIIFQRVDNNGYLSDILIDLLRSVAGTLAELILSNWNEELLYKSLRIPESFIDVLPQLKALKSIETAGILIDTNSSVHLKKFGILVISHDNQWLHDKAHIKTRYRNLRKLDLKDYEPTDDCLYTLANCLVQLVWLRTLCSRVTDAGIVSISKMSDLINLTLLGPSQITDSSIKLLKNLKYLSLPFSDKITEVSITKILDNSPEMKCLYFVESTVSSEFVKKVAKVAKKRKIPMRIGLLNTPGIKQYESQYLRIILLNSFKRTVYWSISFKDI